MRVRRTLGYFLREAAADLWKRRTVNFVSIATIGATLYVLGLFLVLITNVARAVSSMADENRVSVYVADTCTTGDRVALEEKLAGDPAVERVEFVSKDEALMRFRNQFPDLAALAGSLDRNPLPASFEITLRRDAAAADSVQAFAAAAEKMAGVDGVRYDLVWVGRVRSLLRMLAWGGGALGAILLAASTITIAGIIRLNVLARRDEIEILRLVGATRGFIRGPFLFEGAFQGAAAASFSVVMIVATWLTVSSSSRVRSDMLLSLLAGSSVPIWAAAALVVVGIAVGLAGSLLSLRRAFAATT